MEKFKIDGEEVYMFGTSKGSNGNKFNRVNKLAKEYDNIVIKMKSIMERSEPCSEEYSCAVCVMIVMRTGIRVGNEDSAEGYYSGLTYGDTAGEFVQTYGLTTMKREHLKFKDDFTHISFLGKKQVRNIFVLPRELSNYVKLISECKKDPIFGIDDYIFTRFIKKRIGGHFTSKDFRTLRANIYAWQAIKKYKGQTFETAKAAREVINEVADYVSQRLNNTPGVVKKSYINPLIFKEITGYLP